MDNRGRIWIATEHGMYVTNGLAVNPFLLSNPNDKVINSLLIDGSYLYAGTNEGINRIDLDSTKASSLALKDPAGQAIHNYSMVVRIDAHKNLLYYTGYNTGAYYNLNLKTGKSSFLFNKSDGYRAHKTDSKGSLKILWAVETTGLLEHNITASVAVRQDYFKGEKGEPVYSITEAKLDDKDTLWCATDKGLVGMDIVTHKYRIVSFPGHGITSVNDIQLWRHYIICATANKGIIIWNRQNNTVSHVAHQPDDPYSILSNKISQLYVAPGNILLAATAKGISAIPLDNSLQPAYTTIKKGEIHAIVKGKNSWFAGVGNTVYLLNERGLQTTNTLNLQDGEYALTATELQDGDWLVVTNKQVFWWQGIQVKTIQPAPPTHAICERIISANDSTYYLTGQTGIYRWKLGSPTMSQLYQTDGEPYNWYHTVIPVGDSMLLANAHMSFIKLLSIQGDSLAPVAILNTYGNVNDWIALDKDNLLLAGSNGLFKLHKPTARLQPIDSTFHEEIFRFVCTGKDTLLLGERTNYHLKKGKVTPFKSAFATIWNIKDREKVFVDNGYAWLTNGEELYRFSLLQGIEKGNYLYVNLRYGQQNEPDKIELNAGDNMRVGVSSVCYLPYVQYSIRYKLSGVEQAWNNLDGEQIRYTQLRPGRYKLVIQANAGGQRLYQKEIIIVAKPAWYQTIWAMVGFLLCFVLVVFIIFRLRVEAIRRKSAKALALERQMNELERKALRAQMNPHFLFNTLNSINHYILNNDTKEASHYLTQFSRLVRLVLDNSRRELISLKGELEALNLYLELEMMRRNNEFDYSISVKRDVDASSFMVPPLILQPFVENAIWHGLSTIPAGGFIEITVTALGEDGICIVIEDNGIGYAPKAKETDSGKHQSFGMAGTRDRLQLMHPQNKYTIETLYNEEAKPAGTCVSVYIYND